MPRKNITIRDPSRPEVPKGVIITLSYFTSVSLLTNNWRLTPSRILRVLNSRDTGLPKITKEKLLDGLNAACTAGCLEKDDEAYQLTSMGIDSTGIENKTEAGRYSGKRRAAYFALKDSHISSF